MVSAAACGLLLSAARVSWSAEGEPPFPVHYKPTAGAETYYRTGCFQVENTDTGSGMAYDNADTKTLWSWSNWSCTPGGQCDTSPGGFGRSDYLLGYYRSPYASKPGEPGNPTWDAEGNLINPGWAYGGRCESAGKTLFAADGIARTRFFIHSNVLDSTGVFTIALMPEGSFINTFELDLAVINLVKNGTEVVAFGQPHNGQYMELDDLVYKWIDVKVEVDTGSASTSWGSETNPIRRNDDGGDGVIHENFKNASARDDGKMRFTIWADGEQVKQFTISSADVAPAVPWWIQESDGRVKHGTGGSKVVINSRARDYDPALVTVGGTKDYRLDHGNVQVESFYWDPATINL